MKLLRISAIRAIAAVVVGVLLLKYGCNVLRGLTIALGIMFLVAGLVSLIGWINSRRQKTEFRAFDNGQGAQDDAKQPMFPIVGLGSLLLGCMLSLLHTDEFLVWALYLVGAVLILGALNMFMNLFSARKMEPVAVWMWALPAVIIVAAIFVMVKEVIPSSSVQTLADELSPTTLATTILGITAIVYAVIEVFFSVIFYNIKKRFEKTQAQVRRATAAEKEAIKATDLVP
ncbi:MAG: DUF308 domain-containing protein [Prevotella sp.]|nr:DUF308 domain-containing protein [Prevotella sp.]